MSRRALVMTLVIALACLVGLPAAEAGEDRSARKDLELLRQGLKPPRLIPNADVRVAVFTYEDPDGTGLGGGLAQLVARDILSRTVVSSLGVIRYVGDLSPTPDDSLSYFDKVDVLSAAQDVTLAVWGAVRRTPDGVQIDTWVQIPKTTQEGPLRRTLRLPGSLGGGLLHAQVGPDRLLVQRHLVSEDQLGAIEQASAGLGELRRSADDAAPVDAAVGEGDVVTVIDRDGANWIRLRASGGRVGWVRVDGHCVGACAPLLDAAGFVSRLAAKTTKSGYSASMGRSGGNAGGASALLLLIDALGSFDQGEGTEVTVWANEARALAGNRLGGAWPENLEAVGSMLDLIQQASGSYDERVVPSEDVLQIALDLAEATLHDPQNAVVLHNLQVLFRAAGDNKRAALAGELAAALAVPAAP